MKPGDTLYVESREGSFTELRVYSVGRLWAKTNRGDVRIDDGLIKVDDALHYFRTLVARALKADEYAARLAEIDAAARAKSQKNQDDMD